MFPRSFFRRPSVRCLCDGHLAELLASGHPLLVEMLADYATKLHAYFEVVAVAYVFRSAFFHCPSKQDIINVTPDATSWEGEAA